ncbi:MAG: hypothetical protein ABR955_06290 [Verrucomicrobiota bacterium]
MGARNFGETLWVLVVEPVRHPFARPITAWLLPASSFPRYSRLVSHFSPRIYLPTGWTKSARAAVSVIADFAGSIDFAPADSVVDWVVNFAATVAVIVANLNFDSAAIAATGCFSTPVDWIDFADFVDSVVVVAAGFVVLTIHTIFSASHLQDTVSGRHPLISAPGGCCLKCMIARRC